MSSYELLSASWVKKKFTIFFSKCIALIHRPYNYSEASEMEWQESFDYPTRISGFPMCNW